MLTPQKRGRLHHITHFCCEDICHIGVIPPAMIIHTEYVRAWNLKQPLIHGSFRWMMNQIFTWGMVGKIPKHPQTTGWLWSSRYMIYETKL